MKNHFVGQLILVILSVFPNLSNADEPKISSGRYHNLAVNDQGQVYWWGVYQAANYDLGLDEKAQAPTLVPQLPKIKMVAAGMSHSLALAEDGSVYEWGFSPWATQQFLQNNDIQDFCKKTIEGWDRKGRNPCEMAIASKSRLQTPIRIPNIPPAVAIAGSDSQSFVITNNGEVYCWNTNTVPKKVDGLSNIKAIALGQFHAVSLSKDGKVFTWGSNVNGQLGYLLKDKPLGDSACGVASPKFAFEGAIAIASGVNDSYVLLKDGSVWGAGREPNSWLGDPDRAMDPTYASTKYEFRKIAVLPNASEIAGGAQHMVFKTKSGQVYSMGWNGVRGGGLGVESFPSGVARAPIRVETMPNAFSISSTWDHTLALSYDGYVCGWGENNYGAVRPDSERDYILTPIPVMMKDGVTPFNLLSNKTLGKSICGDERWRERISIWNADDERVKSDSKRENDLAKRLSLNLRIPYHSTALIEATRDNNKVAVERLLASCEVDLLAKERYGKTAIEIAQSKGFREIVSLLQANNNCSTKRNH
jgi:alpha-tubulin suppressor-like RCC1 family protein